MHVEYVHFRDRASRSAYIARRFAALLAGRVLDVGCDQAVLRQLLSDVAYVGVDISGKPDLQLNLEQIERLPFDDASFDCVVCVDVLEHLDNLHAMFGELIRVAKRYVILALPNNWANARKPIGRGSGSLSKYGLPAEPPADRHKWFFSLSEAESFVQHQLGKYAVSMHTCHVTEKPRLRIIRAVRRLLYPSQMRYLNRYAHTLWVVLEKTAVSPVVRSVRHG
jgi:SAM-dependent methyltransferase